MDLADKINAINAKVEDCYKLAEEHYGVDLGDRPKIEYDLKGHTAGMASYGKNMIRLNMGLLFSQWDDMLNNTVPHEVAHLIAHKHYGRIKAHGFEWMRVCHVLGIKAERCHTYETKAARVHERPHAYYCRCDKPHMVTNRLHKKMQSGYPYTCNTCGAFLRKGSDA